MKVGVPLEVTECERRVALVPDAVTKLVAASLDVLVQSGAGEAALFSDEAYQEAGATIEPDAAKLYESSDVILKVWAPAEEEVGLLGDGDVLIAFLQPLTDVDLAKRLAAKGVTSFSMDAIPRIARAQSMDALTSMASIAGYKAALMAASSLGKFLPMMITAAGSLPPARGLVLGAGVAGLQAIATSNRLGAVMHGFDIRPAVAKQVESLGAKFIHSQVVDAEAEQASGYAKEQTAQTQQTERELIHDHIRGMDFVISTAAIPGKRAPILITEDMVKDMKPGSIVLDLAAETGGNCELTEPETTKVVHGVSIQGPLNLPSSMPTHASQMYSRNISTLFLHLVQDGKIELDFEDEIVSASCITDTGKIVHGATQALADGDSGPGPTGT